MAKTSLPHRSPQGSEPVLRVRDARKSFQGVPALRGVTLELRAGEAHALLGENGAGKSTLLKILAGVLQPDAGVIELDGVPVALESPQAALRQGIVTIHQELSLFPNLSVAENVSAGHVPRNELGLLDWAALTRRAVESLGRLGVALDPGRLVGELSVAEQQLVEIARALSLDSRVIILDEPTAALSPPEVARLKAILVELRAGGLAVAFVSHRLDEVVSICDRYTVLRDGVEVGGGRLEGTRVEELARLMIGRPLLEAGAATAGAGSRHEPGPVVLEVDGLSTGGRRLDGHTTALHGVSLQARAGEILGIAGLVGSGRTELARAIFGADRYARGVVKLCGEPLPPGSPRTAIRRGIGLVPEDRKQQALFLSLAVKENLSMAGLGRLANRLGFMVAARQREQVEHFRRALAIRMSDPRQPVGRLSGGNQQKVVLARWLALRPRVLIVDEPTRGVDVAARAEVHRLLVDLARSGVAVLVISSDLAELSSLSDRIVALRGGQHAGELARGQVTEAGLLRFITSSEPQPAAA